MQREEETLRVFFLFKNVCGVQYGKIGGKKGQGKRQIIPMIVDTGSTLKQPQ